MSENGKIGRQAGVAKANFRKYLARHKYRTGRNCKNMRQISFRVSSDIHDFFELRAWTESGLKLSKAKVLESLVSAVGPEWFPPETPEK